MLASVQASDAYSLAPAATGGRDSVALQDKLARCIRQLGDWEACPSGKTPEGKKIIANLRAQIGSLENRMSANDNAPHPQPATIPAPVRPGMGNMGGLLSVFA